MTIIAPLYQKDTYSIELLSKSLTAISINFKSYTQETIPSLIELKENMELIKKIIDYYLNYVAINYSDRISKHIPFINININVNVVRSYNSLHLLEISIRQGHSLIHDSLKKMKAIKRHYITSSSRLALKHTKVSNLKSLLKFLKDILFHQIAALDQLRFDNCEYLNYYKRNIALQNSLSRVSSDYPLIAIIDLMKIKCREMNEKFTRQFLYDIEILFDKKKSNIYDLFCLYSINSQVGLSNEAIHSFSAKILICFKTKIKEIIKRTFFVYAEEKNNMTLESMLSIKDIKKLKYEEGKFLEGFKMTLIHLKEVNKMYISYTQVEEKYYFIYHSIII